MTSRPGPPRRPPLWARLLPQVAPTPLSDVLPLLAAPLATMGMAAVSSTHDLTTLQEPPASRSFVFGSSMRACAICLEEYIPGDRLRMLEPCTHCFHQTCIDVWLREAESLRRAARVCPVCNVVLSAPFHREQAEVHDEPLSAQSPWPSVQLIDLSPHQSWVEWFTDLLKLYYPHDNSPAAGASSR